MLGRIGFDAKGDVTGYDTFVWYLWKDGKSRRWNRASSPSDATRTSMAYTMAVSRVAAMTAPPRGHRLPSRQTKGAARRRPREV